MYGRTALLSSIITKARDRVRIFYTLTGTHQQVREDVEWLLTGANFTYGGVDVKVCVSEPWRSGARLLTLLESYFWWQVAIWLHSHLRHHWEPMVFNNVKVSSWRWNNSKSRTGAWHSNLYRHPGHHLSTLSLLAQYCNLTVSFLQIEHALKEWGNGQRAAKFNFSEEMGKIR